MLTAKVDYHPSMVLYQHWEYPWRVAVGIRMVWFPFPHLAYVALADSQGDFPLTYHGETCRLVSRRRRSHYPRLSYDFLLLYRKSRAVSFRVLTKIRCITIDARTNDIWDLHRKKCQSLLCHPLSHVLVVSSRTSTGNCSTCRGTSRKNPIATTKASLGESILPDRVIMDLGFHYNIGECHSQILRAGAQW